MTLPVRAGDYSFICSAYIQGAMGGTGKIIDIILIVRSFTDLLLAIYLFIGLCNDQFSSLKLCIYAFGF